nr:immunoglobulin heavy chain junction region [Mus musculus]
CARALYSYYFDYW